MPVLEKIDWKILKILLTTFPAVFGGRNRCCHSCCCFCYGRHCCCGGGSGCDRGRINCSPSQHKTAPYVILITVKFQDDATTCRKVRTTRPTHFDTFVGVWILYLDEIVRTYGGWFQIDLLKGDLDPLPRGDGNGILTVSVVLIFPRIVRVDDGTGDPWQRTSTFWQQLNNRLLSRLSKILWLQLRIICQTSNIAKINASKTGLPLYLRHKNPGVFQEF